MGWRRTRTKTKTRWKRMKSGGNCAPIDRQRSWSHSWMFKSAGQGGGGEQREAERGDPVAAVWLFKNDSLHTHTCRDSSLFLFFYGCTCFLLYIQHRLVPCVSGRCVLVWQLIGKGWQRSIFILRRTEWWREGVGGRKSSGLPRPWGQEEGREGVWIGRGGRRRGELTVVNFEILSLK